MSKNPYGVLLLHGFSSTPDNYRDLVPLINSSGIPYRVPALRGHGEESPESLRGVNWKEWLADGKKALLELLAEAEKAIVIGHSMGGWIAMHLAIDHRERIDSIVIAAASTRPVSLLGPGRPLHFLVPLVAKLKKKWAWTPVYTDSRLAQHDPSYRWAHADALLQLFDMMKATGKRVSDVNVPILILHSRKDTLNSPEGARILYNSIATPSDRKRLVWFEKTDHFMFLDCEREEVNRTVVDHLKKSVVNN